MSAITRSPESERSSPNLYFNYKMRYRIQPPSTESSSANSGSTEASLIIIADAVSAFTPLTLTARLDVLHACTVTLKLERSKIIAKHSIVYSGFRRDVAMLAAIQESEPIVTQLELVEQEAKILLALLPAMQALEDGKKALEEKNALLKADLKERNMRIYKVKEAVSRALSVLQDAKSKAANSGSSN